MSRRNIRLDCSSITLLSLHHIQVRIIDIVHLVSVSVSSRDVTWSDRMSYGHEYRIFNSERPVNTTLHRSSTRCLPGHTEDQHSIGRTCSLSMMGRTCSLRISVVRVWLVTTRQVNVESAPLSIDQYSDRYSKPCMKNHC